MSGFTSNDSTDLVLEVDASKFVPRAITDPKALERIRKLREDLVKYGYMQPSPPPDEAPPAASPPPA